MKDFMKIFGKPINKWGWVRAASCAVLAGALVWMNLAAVLRNMGGVAWMAWSGYQAFSLLDGVELVIMMLLAVIIAGRLEEQETAESNDRQAEQAIAAHHRGIIKRFHQAVVAVLDAPELPAQTGLRIFELAQAALPELDGKGKGEILHFLFEKGLLTGEKPDVELKGTDFSGVTIHKAHFNGICLEGVDFRNAQMDGAHLGKGRLSGANLSKAFLRHAGLSEAVLTGCNLYGVHLDGANLEGADLRNACLEAAFLRDTNLKNCILNDVPGTDAHSEIVDSGCCQGILDQAILIDTILPDGRKVANLKGKEYLRNKEIEALVNRL